MMSLEGVDDYELLKRLKIKQSESARQSILSEKETQLRNFEVSAKVDTVVSR